MAKAKIDALKLAGGVVSVEASGKMPSKAAFSLYQMYLRGSGFDDIATAKGLPVARVKRIVKSAERYVLAHTIVDVVKLKAQQHIELQAMFEEAKQAWKKSKGEKRKIVRKYDQLGTMTEEAETIEQGAGDIEFLHAAAKFMKEQREIWPGANAPKAQAITNADGSGDAKLVVEFEERLKLMPVEQQKILYEAIEGVATKRE